MKGKPDHEPNAPHGALDRVAVVYVVTEAGLA